MNGVTPRLSVEVEPLPPATNSTITPADNLLARSISLQIFGTSLARNTLSGCSRWRSFAGVEVFAGMEEF